MNVLDQLKLVTKVVADTGDVEQIKKYTPVDATTNPSLILAAAKNPAYASLINIAVERSSKIPGNIDEKIETAMDYLCVAFGCEILKIVPGRVSTEVDASLSFDKEKSIQKALRYAELYKEAGINVEERVLFKLASTWEGLQAAKELESKSMHCNLTLLFSIAQAAVAAEIGATLISPFAGRITDFFKAKQNVLAFAPSIDPGVVSVKNIYNYYKKYNYKTIVMGASFRTADQVKELAGCDALTISPAILESLSKDHSTLPTSLSEINPESSYEKLILTESQFRWMMNEDEMATVKLSEGIRKFNEDSLTLKNILREKLLS